MSSVNQTETNSNIVYEYNFDWTNDRKAVINWLDKVSNSCSIKVRKILLDNMSDRSDEQTESIVLGKIVDKYCLSKTCSERKIDIVSIVAELDGVPVIIGADFRNSTVFSLYERVIQHYMRDLSKSLFRIRFSNTKGFTNE